jgi:hypothetical protein
MNRLSAGLIVLLLLGCSEDEPEKTTTTTPDLEAIMDKFYGATDIYEEGDFIVIKANGVPDHKSPYYKGTQWESTMYVQDTRPGFNVNPNKISSFTYTFKVPKSPKEATNKTPLGTATIGIAINGVPLFNQYAAGNTAIVPGQGEYTSFDLYGGHPAQSGDYHYHIEPNYVTTEKGKGAFIGFLLDGFPVYGPSENGKTLVSSDLDAYHGHTHATTEYPDGIYHYHITADSPYINGNGYFGTAGTWTK